MNLPCLVTNLGVADFTTVATGRVTIYVSTALVDLGHFKLLNLNTVGCTLWMGNQPIGKPQPKQRINVNRQSCLEWDSNT
jgi:hypothetical protein